MALRDVKGWWLGAQEKTEDDQRKLTTFTIMGDTSDKRVEHTFATCFAVTFLDRLSAMGCVVSNLGNDPRISRDSMIGAFMNDLEPFTDMEFHAKGGIPGMMTIWGTTPGSSDPLLERVVPRDVVLGLEPLLKEEGITFAPDNDPIVISGYHQEIAWYGLLRKLDDQLD